MNTGELLIIYKNLWNSRNLENVKDIDIEVVLKELMKRELKDELTHPRVRKNPYEKFYFAVTRITNAEITDEEKVALISRFKGVMEGILEE
ncbi:hypothetical protein [Bacillus sp. FJAT-45066]|uniref:hypothetical protein n=1 Tax=Bacillus sp. FJAT-45066 TaxID=2011010 RepID=UPI000BB87376|nr:hypothetical protein [Bacillus sp. FJAT-45066]